jgi:hypothetical protein
MSELEDALHYLVEINRRGFMKAFEKFKDFNKFDDFVNNCTKEGNKQLCDPLILMQFKKFDINKTLKQNMDDIFFEEIKLDFDCVKLNMAKMFAYNLDNEIVKGAIRRDISAFEMIKKELLENELFEEVEKLNVIKNK